ncbi:MAG: 2-oxoacid:acceptor oxidoreductase family protein [Chloroflexi bacterium]|nr:2-oxoacid:acceptor oxidoreductase family protein [Chloroflexota bacterium]MBU1746688.1 2-oxoacid:acceptor oxidoreductase family protein [Chloroflexota bacterium]MBU1878332.1 2-oxoacid:acceptor oxidoreductase family protein [Chloroflexota bacterium]
MAELTEIRWHGRGGQGVVTAGELLAEAALEEGKYFQAFPDYGPERMGAPIRAFTRFSDKPVDLHCQVVHPDVVVVLDPTLLGVVDVAEGLKDDGVLVANTVDTPAQVRAITGWTKGTVYTVDATRIALDLFGRAITNTPMIGAMLRGADVVSMDSVIDQIRNRFAGKLKADVIEANIKAVTRAYDEAAQG